MNDSLIAKRVIGLTCIFLLIGLADSSAAQKLHRKSITKADSFEHNLITHRSRDGSGKDEEAKNPLGRTLTADELAEIELLDIHGTSVRLSAFESAEILVVAFVGTECPLVRLYAPRLDQIQSQYSAEKVRVIAVDSNQQDSLEELRAFQARQSVKLPLLKDPANRLANLLAAERTPEVVVLDQTRKIRYQGRIDDQYGVGYSRGAANSNELRDAIETLLKGDPVAEPRTKAVGCVIGRELPLNSSARYTYASDIAPLLERHCVECHQEGEIGPLSLTNYDDVRGWAGMIGEVVAEGRMPPWSAEPGVGEFANERGMTDDEREILFEWIRDGAPLGEANLSREAKSESAEWQLGREPDLILDMGRRPFRVPANGVVEYQYFVVNPDFKTDRWVRAAEVIPGDRGVVHHAIVFFRAPDSNAKDHLGWIAGYVPGQRVAELPDGMARRVPAGARFVFQMHYTPNGRSQNDMTKIGLYFADDSEINREVITIPVVEKDFELVPFESDQLVTRRVSGFPQGSDLLSVTPHMHFRGDSFELNVRQLDSSQESNEQTVEAELETKALLSVPNYDFNWQHTYRFENPLPLDPNLEFECRNVFDNSIDKLSNPDPSQSVRWGDQTFEEMAVTFFDVALPEGETAESLFARAFARPGQNKQDVEQTAREFIERFDRNGDERVSRREVTHVFATLGFHRYDLNDDGLITFDEACEYQRQQR